MSAPAGEDPNPEYPKFPTLVARFRQEWTEQRDDEVTVDHWAEAEEVLAHRASPNEPHGLAAAHALLALTEQQRIANLIAYYSIHHQAQVREEIERRLWS